MESLDFLSTRVEAINPARIVRRGSVLECATALALLWMRRDRKRLGTGKLQDQGPRRRFMERGGALFLKS